MMEIKSLFSSRLMPSKNSQIKTSIRIEGSNELVYRFYFTEVDQSTLKILKLFRNDDQFTEKQTESSLRYALDEHKNSLQMLNMIENEVNLTVEVFPIYKGKISKKELIPIIENEIIILESKTI